MKKPAKVEEKKNAPQVVIPELGGISELGDDVRIADLPLPGGPHHHLIHQSLRHHGGNLALGLLPAGPDGSVHDGIPQNLLILLGGHVESASVIQEHAGIVGDVNPACPGDHCGDIAEGLHAGLGRTGGSGWRGMHERDGIAGFAGSIDRGPNQCRSKNAQCNQESSLLGNVGDFDICEESYGVELSGE